MKIQTIIYATALLLLAGCHGSQRYETQLLRAEQMLETSDDSVAAAGQVLDSIGSNVHSLHRKQLMRYKLLQMKVRNKQDRLTEGDTTFSQVADYYRRHGSANEQVEAIYLLARAYHNMGRLPQAIDLYQQADQAADTTRSDCNWKHLFLVHSQLSQLYSEQCLPDRNSEEIEIMRHLAIKSNDTLYVLACDVWKAGALWDCGKYDEAVQLENSSSKRMAEAGYEQWANGCHSLQICRLLEQGKVKEARAFMDLQERESGIFDNLGNIEKGREIYYYSMGTYHLLINYLDSAEFYYRRLLTYPMTPGNLEAGYKGLFNLYIKKSVKDSIAKYAQLYCNANDSALKKLSTEKIQFIRSLYDYSRYQELAKSKAQENKTTRYIACTIVLILVLAYFATAHLFYKYRRAIRNKLEEENEKYAETYRRYTRLIKEKEVLEQELSINEEGMSSIKKEKDSLESDIERLNNIIAQRQEDHARPEKWNLESQILTCQEVVALHQFAIKGKAPGTLWSDLYNELNLYLPRFMECLNRKEYRLTDFEKQIVVLIKLRFIGSEIQNLLEKSPQSITNSRANINKKMFKGKGATGLNVSIYKSGEVLRPVDVKDVKPLETPCLSDNPDELEDDTA